MTVFNSFVDSLAGFLGGLQGDREQLAQQQGALAATSAMDPAALELSYRTDWVARKGIDIPAKDATRQWRSWQAEQDAIEKLEETERLFKIRSRVRTAMTRARLYGGCIIVPGLKSQTDLTKPLDLTKVGKGDLVYCHVISQQSATAGIPIEDIESEWYGQPSYYQLRSRDGSQDIRIHPSRTIKMVGAEMPDERAAQLTAHQGWGDSALLTVAAAVRDTNLITDAIAAMAQDARIDVFRIPNLTANITTKGYKDRLTERLQFAQNAKSIVNSLVMDKEEEWDRRETSFTALPDLIKIYLMICAGGFDIPVTRFLGDSPSGLNATGVSDLRNYYDNVKAGQELELSPVLSPLDELLIRTTFGTRDPAIYYEWNPLWQEDAAAKAARAVQYASVFKTDVDAALFNPDVLREARLNQLIELGIYPGIEGLTEEYDLADVPEPAAPLPGQPGGPPAANANDPAAAKPAAAAPPRKAGVADRRAAIRARVRDHQRRAQQHVGDARPRTLYVRRDVVNADEILRWAKAQGFDTTVPAAELHVTVTFSRDAVDWMTMGEAYSYGPTDGDRSKGQITISQGGPRIVDQLGPENGIVLMFASTELSYRHQSMRSGGASFDFPEYQPHITITYAGTPEQVQKARAGQIEPYRGKIVLGPEIFEEVNPDWKQSIQEEG